MNILTLGTFFIVSLVSAAPVTGTVRTASGEPLSGVFLFYDRGITDVEMTDPDGAFSLSHNGGVISFYLEGYQPLIKVVSAGTTTQEIVLESGQATEWIVPPCKTLKNPGRRIGFLLRLPVPRGTKTNQVRDVDYTAFDLGYGSGKERAWIQGIVGLNSAPGGPPSEWILDASEYTVRSYRAANWKGFDVRGTSLKGDYWRYLGWVGQSVRYRVSSRETAIALDKIIDGACH